jgi:hypothetical protein
MASHSDGDLLAAIYDAIIEPSGWDEVVKRIVKATGSVSGIIATQPSPQRHSRRPHRPARGGRSAASNSRGPAEGG